MEVKEAIGVCRIHAMAVGVSRDLYTLLIVSLE